MVSENNIMGNIVKQKQYKWEIYLRSWKLRISPVVWKTKGHETDFLIIMFANILMKYKEKCKGFCNKYAKLMQRKNTWKVLFLQYVAQVIKQGLSDMPCILLFISIIAIFISSFNSYGTNHLKSFFFFENEARLTVT